MAKTTRRTIYLSSRVPPDLLRSIDEWKDKMGIASRNEAMNFLMRAALDAEDAKAARRARRTAA